jgi:hypothetical protein
VRPLGAVNESGHKKTSRLECPIAFRRLQETGSSIEKILNGSATERLRVIKLLAEERAKFKLEFNVMPWRAGTWHP